MGGTPAGGSTLERATDEVLADAKRRLRLTLVLLVVLVVSLGLVERHTDLWPIVTWPVYDDARPEVPGPTRSRLEVRARTTSGTTYVLRSEDLVEFSRRRISSQALEGSVDDADDRSYLTRLVRLAVGEDIEFLELWEVIWRVEALTVPPIDPDRPLAERRLVGFPADDPEATL